jgi:heptosyltransferase III
LPWSGWRAKRVTVTRILFITSTRIGDAVQSTSLLRSLIEVADQPEVTIACGPLPAPLFAGVPGLSRVLAMAKKPNGGHWFDLWRSVVSESWDIAVDLRGSLVTSLVRARRRIVVRKVEASLHRVDGIAAAAGVGSPPLPWVPVPEDAKASAEAWAGKLPGDGRILALGIGANWVGKRWPVERFVEAALALTTHGGVLEGASIAAFGTPDEAQLIEQFIAGYGARSGDVRRIVNLAGAFGLMETQARLERATLFIGNDSGLMHMAAAAGAPTLGLFGPSNEVWYAPRGPITAAIREGRSFDALRAIDPKLNGPTSLMDDLSVDGVVKAANTLLERAPR